MKSSEIELARYNRLIHLPRPEDIPPLQAVLKQTEAEYENRQKQLEFYQNVKESKAFSRSDYTSTFYDKAFSFSKMEEAKGQLELLLAGAWVMDMMISKAEIDESEAALKVISTDIERSLIRSPLKGRVLQVNVRKGELAEKRIEEADPLMIVGSIDPLHIRVDVDEEMAWRIQSGTPATAFVRGNSSLAYPLQFVRIEPYIIPKESFTGDTKERVDTRVLQVIYRFPDLETLPYVGQIMDVFIQTPSSS